MPRILRARVPDIPLDYLLLSASAFRECQLHGLLSGLRIAEVLGGQRRGLKTMPARIAEELRAEIGDLLLNTVGEDDA